ncbi:MAG: branched-chain amino acid ABC transporter substrate-binding protein [Betaproteobacteria bacterium SG8_39]|nr:MAG: branched-chain amino acid ABC transporter substrate-binding protein [Betaproteobacteria bacterium SG8_39]
MIDRRQFTRLAAALAVGFVAAPSLAADPVRVAFIDPLSGPFAAVGASGLKQFQFIANEINKSGGVLGGRKIEVIGFDNKISPKESLIQLKRVIGDGIQVIVQGNSSGVANALTDAVAKHNEREPSKRVLYLNYSAVDPSLTNEKCNYWHFRFDANADMKMNALTDVINTDKKMKSIYIIGQDYSFGKAVAAAAVRDLGLKRPDIKIAGNELHPIGKVKDFSPYIAKIKASGAQAVITGNWGADMLGLAKAANDAGLEIPFYTYYAAANGITKAIGAGGVDKVRLVGEGATNPPLTAEWRDVLKRFRAKYPDDRDFTQTRIANTLQMLALAINKAKSTEPAKVAAALEGMRYTTYWGDVVTMRASDHQLQMPVRIFVHTNKNIEFDIDHSGYGLLTESTVSAHVASTPTTCKMQRP